jgi:hypothetical protein
LRSPLVLIKSARKGADQAQRAASTNGKPWVFLVLKMKRNCLIMAPELFNARPHT